MEYDGNEVRKVRNTASRKNRFNPMEEFIVDALGKVNLEGWGRLTARNGMIPQS